MSKKYKTHIFLKTVCLILVIAVPFNQVSFAMDEVRSCLAVPNFFNPPCRIVTDPVTQKPHIDFASSRTDLPAVLFLWYTIAAALDKGLTKEELKNLISEVIENRFNDGELDSFDWGSIEFEDNSFILHLSGSSSIKYRFFISDSKTFQTETRLTRLQIGQNKFVTINIIIADTDKQRQGNIASGNWTEDEHDQLNEQIGSLINTENDVTREYNQDAIKTELTVIVPKLLALMEDEHKKKLQELLVSSGNEDIGSIDALLDGIFKLINGPSTAFFFLVPPNKQLFFCFCSIRRQTFNGTGPFWA